MGKEVGDRPLEDREAALVLGELEVLKEQGASVEGLLMKAEELRPKMVEDARIYYREAGGGWRPYERGLEIHPTEMQEQILERYYPEDFKFLSAKPTGATEGPRVNLFEQVCEWVWETEAGKVPA